MTYSVGLLPVLKYANAVSVSHVYSSSDRFSVFPIVVDFFHVVQVRVHPVDVFGWIIDGYA